MDKESRSLQLLVLQDAEDPKLKPFIRAQLARAYRELGEFRLRLKGKGPPKAVDYVARRHARKSSAKGFSETPAAAAAKPESKPF